MTTAGSSTALKAMMIDLSGKNVERAVDAIINHVVKMQASDLFISVDDEYVAVHARALGIVHQVCIVSQEEGKRYVAHIKAVADMDVAERRKPQDGRWIFRTEDEDVVDLRLNMIPTMYGEDLALRLLAREGDRTEVEMLGLLHDQYNEVCAMLESPSGMILCTGPTGSGKTTTLYSCLRRLHDGKRKINTIEDPIEYAVEGMHQSQINSVIGVGFSELLRAVLRQGPDVIMIGEIRDSETAEIAVRAANSGHLVFATVHASVAAGALQSLRAFGVHGHFLSSALRGVLSQRLVRTLCDKCKIAVDLDNAPHTFDQVRKWLGPNEGKVLYAPKGCENCNFQGYDNRAGVFELMSMSAELRRMISQDRPTREIRHKAIEQGMLEFRHTALLKVARGETSTEEIFRVIPTEHLMADD